MNKTTRSYRLPNGRYTLSVTRYLREWRALTRPFAKTFGLRIIGFDPGVLMTTGEGGYCSMSVPLSVLRTFNDKVLPKLKS